MNPDFSQLGVTGALVVVTAMFLRFMSEADKKRIASENNMADALKENTDYLRQRNGRDNEKHEELVKATQEIPRTLERIADKQVVGMVNAVMAEHQRQRGLRDLERLSWPNMPQPNTPEAPPHTTDSKGRIL